MIISTFKFSVNFLWSENFQTHFCMTIKYKKFVNYLNYKNLFSKFKNWLGIESMLMSWLILKKNNYIIEYTHEIHRKKLPNEWKIK